MTTKTFDLDAMPGYLLTVSGNPKLAKGLKQGYWTAGLCLAPHKASGVMNTCAFASAGCAAACLNLAGRGGMALDGDGLNAVQVARIQRTRWFKRDKAAFMQQLEKEIGRHVKRCEKDGFIPAIRLNTVSDLPWERLGIMEKFPTVLYYDYTKVPISRRFMPANYHLTFSLAENNDEHAIEALNLGVNVAVVLDISNGKQGGIGRKPMPATMDFGGQTWNVIDGDDSDLRFLDGLDADGRAQIVGLRAKGTRKMRADGVTSGFVRSSSPIHLPPFSPWRDNKGSVGDTTVVRQSTNQTKGEHRVTSTDHRSGERPRY